MNLYENHVPKELADIFGQTDVVAQMRDIRRKLVKGEEVSQCYALTGQYGIGKSAMAKILADILDCEVEVFNSAHTNGVDFGRRFAAEILPYRTLSGRGKAFIIEEAHKMTAEAQECLLMPLEKQIPPGSCVIFTTTEPEKIKRIIASGRARHFELKPLSVDELCGLLNKVDMAEGFGIANNPDLIERIAYGSNGSARLALTNLEKVAAMPLDDRDAWQPPNADDSDKASYLSLRDALSNAHKTAPETAWGEIADALRKIKADGDDAEGVRRFLLGTYAGRLLSPKCGTTRGMDLFGLSIFEDSHYYDSGFPGLVKDCAEFSFGVKRGK
ncbi:MAG: hypothetical protein FWH21_00930 [Kiritimatiellaeota bacterium]|nr:hypothetical protein [Kiritimatiellota bacterium]